MKLTKNIKIVDLALLIGNNLVICDVHLGYEEYLNKTGVFVPRFGFEEIIKRLESIFSLRQFDKIIINGDIKHEFGVISNQEWRHTLHLIDFLKKYCNEVILIKGNHDKILGPIADKRNVKVLDFLKLGDVLIIHGDKIPKGSVFDKINTIIIGHEHPAIGLSEAKHIETYKCYLQGKFENKTLIVQPSLNLVTQGTNILNETLLSPFLKDISNFEVFVVSDNSDILEFGKLKDI